eukprot:7883096-Ditylum_brightwellii.AAC.1
MAMEMGTGAGPTAKNGMIATVRGKYSKYITDGPMVLQMENTTQAALVPTRNRGTKAVPLSLTGLEATQEDLNDGQGGQLKRKGN